MSQFCQPHWDELREAIGQAGLGGWIADTGEEVTRRLQRQQTDGWTVDTFEPLMIANVSLTITAAERGFLKGCPVCQLPEKGLVNEAPEATPIEWVVAAVVGMSKEL